MSSTPTGEHAAAPLLAGVVVRAHGLRGEVVVEVRTDSPDARFADGAVLVARRPGAPDGRLTVASARPHSGRLLVRFVEAPDRDAAEALRGTRLLVRRRHACRRPMTPTSSTSTSSRAWRVELVDGAVGRHGRAT